MTCKHCESKQVVMNGRSRHGNQRWLCRQCGKTFGESDKRRVDPQKRSSALQHYLEGVGQRATERLVGVSHNSIINWVHEAVKGKALASVDPDDVEWIEADEMWTYVAKKKMLAGSGGLLIVLPRKSAGGRWGIVRPKRPGAWMRSFLAVDTSPTAPTSGTPTDSSSVRGSTSRARRTPSP